MGNVGEREIKETTHLNMTVLRRATLNQGIRKIEVPNYRKVSTHNSTLFLLKVIGVCFYV